MHANINIDLSPSHLRLLKFFIEPRDVKYSILELWETRNVKNPQLVIDNWLKQGILVPSKAEDALSTLFLVKNLTEFLKARNLPIAGRKSELIGRLLDSDIIGMEKILSEHQVVQCSQSALEMINDYKLRIQQEKEFEMKKCFEMLINDMGKDACKVYVAYMRHHNYEDQDFCNYDNYQISPEAVSEIQYILKSNLEVLNHLPSDLMRIIKAIACMKILWISERFVASEWVPEGTEISDKDLQVAIIYLIVNANFNRNIKAYKKFAEKIQLNFHPGDLDSCSLCLSLDGKVFDINDDFNFPELPMKGCTSETGCQCSISEYFDVFDDEEDNEDEFVENNDPIIALRILKKMWDESLIKENEFEEKKKEILSRL